MLGGTRGVSVMVRNPRPQALEEQGWGTRSSNAVGAFLCIDILLEEES